MKKLISLCVLFLFANINPASSQENIITASDFTPLIGTGWKGNLTYTDYTSGKFTVIPAELSVSQINDTSFELFIKFPYEPHANSADTIHILNGGTYLDNEKIVSVQRSEGTTTITAETIGTDNNKPAQFKFTYSINSDEFIIMKEVKNDDSPGYFVRNKYMFNK